MEHRTHIAHAPGRVNLIGDHTDYNEGLAFPMAIDLATDVTFTENDSGRLLFLSPIDPQPASVPVDVSLDPDEIEELQPPWARFVAATAALGRPPLGGVGRVQTTLPVGAGLSSSAALCVALALVFGVESDPETVARLCQRAEEAAGSDVGLMDPLTSMAGRAGHGLLIDFSTITWRYVAIPHEAEVLVVHSGQPRELAATPYRARRAECEAAALELGVPLGQAEEADLPGVLDPIMRRRTRHVISECRRVREFAECLEQMDLAGAGRVMVESHQSLALDFEASTPKMDSLVQSLLATPGIYGARLTGGGFGGCVVALARKGAVDPSRWSGRGWRVAAAPGATVRVGTSAVPA
ncbi:MAG TPA: galactokinase family protein [Acidimicrobiales bacterium]|nr:galactokinase family protein [Acidimicrobiales bacterium]